MVSKWCAKPHRSVPRWCLQNLQVYDMMPIWKYVTHLIYSYSIINDRFPEILRTCCFFHTTHLSFFPVFIPLEPRYQYFIMRIDPQRHRSSALTINTRVSVQTTPAQSFDKMLHVAFDIKLNTEEPTRRKSPWYLFWLMTTYWPTSGANGPTFAQVLFFETSNTLRSNTVVID